MIQFVIPKLSLGLSVRGRRPAHVIAPGHCGLVVARRVFIVAVAQQCGGRGTDAVAAGCSAAGDYNGDDVAKRSGTGGLGAPTWCHQESYTRLICSAGRAHTKQGYRGNKRQRGRAASRRKKERRESILGGRTDR